MAQIKTHNLSEQIAQYIGEKIIQLEIKPGERILEAKLAEALGVSRSPVREAFRILERYRLVELIPRKGVKATKITECYILCLYDILKVNFGLMANLAVKRAGDDQLKKVKEVLLDLWPSIRRIQFASLNIRAEKLKENGAYFKKRIIHLEQDNPGMTEKTVGEYAENEKQFAINILKKGLI